VEHVQVIPVQPTGTWIAACRSPSVAVSGSCTLRQSGGFAYLSATFSWTACRVVSGAPDGANASTELATCSASG
jgi:hypothetical protein